MFDNMLIIDLRREQSKQPCNFRFDLPACSRSLFALFLRKCSEHKIPKRRAYSEIVIRVHIMMPHVLLLQVERNLSVKAEMVDSIVGQIISEVAEYEPSKERRKVVRAENVEEKSVKKRRQRNADYRGHNKTG